MLKHILLAVDQAEDIDSTLADHVLVQAEATGAELIVIGGHHAHNVRERILGDIGKELAHRALCPILLMPSAAGAGAT